MVSEKSKYADYSGEDIFRGLFFFQNELSNDISHLREVKSRINDLVSERNSHFTSDENSPIFTEDDLNRHLNEMSDVSISFIYQNYPGFFNDFGEIMRSGDFYEIEKVMNLSGKLINQSLLSSDKYQDASIFTQAIDRDIDLKNKVLSLDLSTADGQREFETLYNSIDDLKENISMDGGLCIVLAAVVVAVVVVAAVVAAVVVEVEFWGNEPGPEGLSGLARIDRELYIADISKSLLIPFEK
ncbi:MAG: hypothetical protein OXE77_12060 [Flavobacteriaceae bacterium]|nr:hypothetical protein [Flavobacteriaceae bacterium]MCY4267632.1 hypothetical protein [Flavobacteriaceae bacterium]